jgi:O-methyltransferase
MHFSWHNSLHSLVQTLNNLFYKVFHFRITRQPPIARQLDYGDPLAVKTMRAVRDRTMTDENRLENLILAIRYVTREAIPGAVVECGVWRGGSMMAAALTLLEVKDTSRELYLYDTFEGMTEPKDFDRDFRGESAAEQILEARKRQGEYSTDVTAYASLSDVKLGMESTKYPSSQIKYVVGDVIETLQSGEIPKEIAVLRLDTDWYESTKVELEILWSRVSTGGIVILDDYDHWEGAKKAVDDFFAMCPKQPFLMKMLSGRVIVKTYQ